jgi:5-methylcytosine-specific restriction enzyme subunit McrC
MIATESLALEVPEAGHGSAPPVRALTAGQLAALLSVPELVRVSAAPGGLWRISGRRRVGVVQLGSGRDAIVLHLRPKLEIADLLLLLAHVARDPWRERDVAMGTQEGLAPEIAGLFARVAGRALDGGVLHGYREFADSLYAVRGRIDVPAQMRRAGLPIPVSVVFDDFTADIAENRILGAALTRLAMLPRLPPHTGATLRHLLGRLVGVQVPPPGSPLPKWMASRLNERYLPALRLAELVLADTAPDIRPGTSAPSRGIVLNMESIFETFLESALGAAARRHGLRCVGQETHHRLDAGRRVKIRPDLTVYRTDALHCVVDAKYKSSGDGNGEHEDLYQVVAYCSALGLNAGHLVYAEGPAKPVTHRIGSHGMTVTVHSLDLGSGYAKLIAAIDELARGLAGLAG